MPTIYPPLSIGAKARLAMFKRKALKPAWVRPMTWRDVRFATLKSRSGLDQGLNDGSPIWYTHEGEQFRRVKWANEVISRLPQGYYTDCDGCETARGFIVALPHGRFIAGYEWSDNGERVYFSTVFDDEEDAAREADHQAEEFAETAREDSYRYNEARKIEDKIEDSLTRLRECLALRHRACMAYVRDEARELCETIREARETLRTDFADYI